MPAEYEKKNAIYINNMKLRDKCKKCYRYKTKIKELTN